MRPEDLLARLEAGYAYDPMYGQLCNERDQLKAENAKLRGLVADMYTTIRSNNSWWDWACKDTKHFAERMRELGMEVDKFALRPASWESRWSYE